MQTPEWDELHWTAFRYVAGELSDAECALFEERLAAEQPAREAVARAARLAEAIALAESPAAMPSAVPAGAGFSSSSRGAHRGRSAWQLRFAALAALCAVLIVGIGVWAWKVRGVPDTRVAESERPGVAGSLERRLGVLALWLEWNAATAGEDVEGAAGSHLGEEALGSLGTTSDEFLGDPAESEFEVPGWMIAALSPEQASGPDDSGEAPREN